MSSLAGSVGDRPERKVISGRTLSPADHAATASIAEDVLPASPFRLDLYNLAPDFDATNHAAIADFNGDGLPDIFFANHNQPLRLHINAGRDTDGDGYLNFIPINAFPAQPLCSLGAVVHDLTDDGLPDIIVGRRSWVEECLYGFQNMLWVNNGDGTFTDGTANLPSDNYWTTAIAVADLDDDGLPDLVLANGRVNIKDPHAFDTVAQPNVIYRNRGDTDGDGVPNFVEMQPWTAENATQGVAVSDVNGDGLPDIFFANYNQPNVLYVNQGVPPGGDFPDFLDATADRMPAEAGRTDPSRVAAFGDLDLDGDPDLVVGVDGDKPRLYVNDGSGHFSDATSLIPDGIGDRTIYTWDVQIADFSNDGFPDVLLAGEQNVLLVNDPSSPPHFTDGSELLVPGVFTTLSAAWGDLNADGLVDLVLADYFEQNRLQFGTPTGFVDATTTITPPDGDLTRDVLFADFDDDGHDDILILNDYHDHTLYRNTGTGLFVDATPPVLQAGHPGETMFFAEAGDLDLDGDMDVALASSDRLHILRNLGDGDFSLDTIFSTGAYITDVLVHDLTGDGYPDIYLTVSRLLLGDRHRLFVNDGSGNFLDQSLQRLPLILWRWPADAEVIDFDLDGDPDLIVGGWEGIDLPDADRIFENDGSGYFTDVTDAVMPETEGDITGAVAVADVNGDGYPDIFLGNYHNYCETPEWTSTGQNRLYINQGGTSFTEVPMPQDSFATRDALFTDYDLDGDPDIVIVNWLHTDCVPPLEVRETDRVYLYVNEGDGQFSLDASAFPIVSSTGEGLTSVAVSDVNGDGYPDIYASTDGQNRLYINHARALEGGTLCGGATGGALPAHRADLDCDGDVDVTDIHMVADAWPAARGRAGYRQYYDLDHDGRISVVDVMLVASHWGETFDFGPHFPLDYGPYRPGQAPGGPTPSPAEIDQDMALMAQETKLIRTYAACDELATIPPGADGHGIHIYQGVALSATPSLNDEEMASFAALVGEHQNIVAGVIGDETLLFGELSEWDLVGYLNRAKELGNVPVTTGESWGVWCNEAPLKPRCQGRALLGEAVDLILAHSHPYWEGVPIEHTAAHVMATYLTLRATYPNRVVVIGETGWPTCGDVYGNAAPSLENQHRFIEELWRWSNLYHAPTLYFEAFDEEWKVAEEGPVGGCWGLYYADRTPKHDSLDWSIPPPEPTPTGPSVRIEHPRDITTTVTRPNCAVPIFGRAYNAGPGWHVKVEVFTDQWYVQDQWYPDGLVPITDGMWGVPEIFLAGQGGFNNHRIRATLVDETGTEIASDEITGIVRTNACGR